MTTYGISMMRNEADVAEAVCRHMLTQVDAIIVADNMSDDGTLDILERLVDELDGVQVVEDHEPAYYQSRKMSALAAMASDQGADWVVPFDADELWFSRDGRRIADVLAELPAMVVKAAADVWDHVATGQDDAAEANPFRRIRWRRDHPLPLPKVACRALSGIEIMQGNHEAFVPGMPSHVQASLSNALTIRHFPYRSPEQMVSKVRQGAAAYRLMEEDGVELGGTGAHWREWGDILDVFGEQAIIDIFHQWFYREVPDQGLIIGDERQNPLIYDPAPITEVAKWTS